MKSHGFIGYAGVLVLSLCALARGQWCVATNGNDSNTGLSWDQALLTIGSAVAKAHTAGGGVVEVSNGVYTLGAEISVTQATTIRGVNGRDQTVVNGNGATRCFKLDHTDAALRGLTVSNGFTTGYGGGVLINRGGVYNCRITHNVVSNGIGGGIGYNAPVATTATISNCLITCNEAQQGGGIGTYDGYLALRGNLVVADCEIISNRVYQNSKEAYGGGMYFYGQDLILRNSRFLGNRYGGNLSSKDGTAYGGGLSVNASHRNVLVENCAFLANALTNVQGSGCGAGVHLSGSDSVLRNCLIADNVAGLNSKADPRGVGIFVHQASKTNRFESCTIVGNTMDSKYNPGGAGVYLSGNGQDEMWNSIACFNRDKGVAADWYLGDAARKAFVHFTCTPVVMDGDGNLTDPPQFADWEGGDFHLAPGSPCIDRGSNQAWMNAAVDLDGKRRVDRVVGVVDLGAYEHSCTGSLFYIR